MRIISTRTHAIIDYVFGVLLIAAPYVLGFANGGPEHLIPAILGAAIIGMSLITKYEISFAKLIPVPAHLTVDVLGGLLLAASPWLFDFADRVFWPHLIFGLLEVGTALMTETRPAERLGTVSAR